MIRHSFYRSLMKLAALLAVAVIFAGCGPAMGYRYGCERITDQVYRCVTNDVERGRVDVIYASQRHRNTPAQDRVKSLERGITGGPSVVAVDSCGTRDRLYIVAGMFDIEASSSPFDVVDVSGTHVVGAYGMDQDIARVRRDSLRASSSDCLVWSED